MRKIHRVMTFTEAVWTYIDKNMDLRKTTTTEFEKDLFKLLNNSVFGKSMQNNRKQTDVRLATYPHQIMKLSRKPQIDTWHIIDDGLVVVTLKKALVKLDRPIYLGSAILDISKMHMYDFHFLIKHGNRVSPPGMSISSP